MTAWDIENIFKSTNQIKYRKKKEKPFLTSITTLNYNFNQLNVRGNH